MLFLLCMPLQTALRCERQPPGVFVMIGGSGTRVCLFLREGVWAQPS